MKMESITIGARVPPAMHKELKLLAALNGTSQSVEIIKAVRERICIHRKQLERMRNVKLEELVAFLDNEHPNWRMEGRPRAHPLALELFGSAAERPGPA